MSKHSFRVPARYCVRNRHKALTDSSEDHCMAHPRNAAALLLTAGSVGGIGMLAGATLPISLPGRIAIGFGLFASGAFLLTGVAWLYAEDSDTALYSRVPAVSLLLVGLTAIGWSLVEFEPWRVYGWDGVVLDQTLRILLVVLSAGLGIAFVLVGLRWARRRQMRYPLAILSVGLSIGEFHLGFQAVDSFLPPIPTPVLGLVLVLAVLPALVILYKLPNHPRPVD